MTALGQTADNTKSEPKGSSVGDQMGSEKTTEPSTELEKTELLTEPLTEPETAEPSTAGPAKKGTRFWLNIATLSVVATLGGLDGTIISTSLPNILTDLGGSNSKYVWVSGAFFLAM
jgi:hypothetical protein